MILSELHLMRRNFGQINLAAGMANDTVGWLLLGVISGLAASGKVSVGRVLITVGGMLGFLVVSFVVGQRAIDAALRRTRSEEPRPSCTRRTGCSSRRRVSRPSSARPAVS